MSVLPVESTLKSKVLTYEDNLDQKNVANYESFFKIKDELKTACPVVKCELFKVGCVEPHGNDNVSIGSSGTF